MYENSVTPSHSPARTPGSCTNHLGTKQARTRGMYTGVYLYLYISVFFRGSDVKISACLSIFKTKNLVRAHLPYAAYMVSLHFFSLTVLRTSDERYRRMFVLASPRKKKTVARKHIACVDDPLAPPSERNVSFSHLRLRIGAGF